MGIVSHRYGDFFHHFAGKLPLAARADRQPTAEPWLSSVWVVHTHLRTLMRKECHQRKYDPANQLPDGFSSQVPFVVMGSTYETPAHIPNTQRAKGTCWSLLNAGEAVSIPIWGWRWKSSGQTRLVLSKKRSVSAWQQDWNHFCCSQNFVAIVYSLYLVFSHGKPIFLLAESRFPINCPFCLICKLTEIGVMMISFRPSLKFSTSF